MTTDDATTAQRLYAKLTKQWAWLDGNEDHPEALAREGIFLRTLERYEATCQAVEEPDPCPSA